MYIFNVLTCILMTLFIAANAACLISIGEKYAWLNVVAIALCAVALGVSFMAAIFNRPA